MNSLIGEAKEIILPTAEIIQDYLAARRKLQAALNTPGGGDKARKWRSKAEAIFDVMTAAATQVALKASAAAGLDTL